MDCIPLGMMASLVKALANGQQCIVSTIGEGTFLDPRTGTGSAIMTSEEGLITACDDGLCYSLPKIDVAIFNAPAADDEGNIYFDECTTMCDAKEAAIAAKRNSGRVIVNVGRIVDKNPDAIVLSADKVDAIVYYPDTEQTATIPHSKPLAFLTEGYKGNIDQALDTVRLMNRVAGITPTRDAAEKSIAQHCARLMRQQIPKGAYVNIGTGLPELVCSTLYEQGRLSDYNLFTEAGVIGGMPAPGIFFGASIAPKRIISSPEMFDIVNKELEATILGFLQVDSEGNVNASKRGEGAVNFVGPGGFIDLSCAAKTVIFVGSWMAKGKVKVKRGRTSISKKGMPKFIDKVDQVTFSGKAALAAGKNVFYLTDVGTFQLTDQGMVLIELREGIDVQRDILDFSVMRIVGKY